MNSWGLIRSPRQRGRGHRVGLPNQRLRSLEVHDELERCRLLDREFSRRGPLKTLVDKYGSALEQLSLAINNVTRFRRLRLPTDIEGFKLRCNRIVGCPMAPTFRSCGLTVMPRIMSFHNMLG